MQGMMNTSQAALLPKYAQLISSYKIHPAAAVEAKRIADRILKNRSRYDFVEKLTRVPWWFVAGLHKMECGNDFGQHLANGDPIDRATVNEPEGIPPGTWEECAIAALKLKGWLKSTNWDDKLVCLWRCERYNGFGYAQYHPDVPTPYLWAGTDKYIRGKYVSDGKWDPNAISQQIGIVAIWAALGINLGGCDLMQKIGTVEIAKDTWLKSHPLPSTDPTVLKVMIEKGATLDLYERRTNEERHYHLIVGRDGQMPAKVYIYDLHAGIDLDDEDKPEDNTYVPKAAAESTPKIFDPASIDWSDPSDPISKYFTVVEATKGELARTPKKGSIEANNIIKLAAQLDKLREAYGKPIRVTSWYRPSAINRAIGGASQSQHINGGAADVCPMDGNIEAFQNWCDERWFGALGYGAHKGFVHLDIRNKKGFMDGGEKGTRWTY